MNSSPGKNNKILAGHTVAVLGDEFPVERMNLEKSNFELKLTVK